MTETIVIIAYFLGMFTLLALQLALAARANLKELEEQLAKEKIDDERRKTKTQNPDCR